MRDEPTTSGVKWAVKRRDGVILRYLVRDLRADAIDAAVSYGVRTGLVQENPELFGPDYFSKQWRRLRDYGFSLVRVRVLMFRYEAWAWPECREVGVDDDEEDEGLVHQARAGGGQ